MHGWHRKIRSPFLVPTWHAGLNIVYDIAMCTTPFAWPGSLFVINIAVQKEQRV